MVTVRFRYTGNQTMSCCHGLDTLEIKPELGKLLQPFDGRACKATVLNTIHRKLFYNDRYWGEYSFIPNCNFVDSGIRLSWDNS